MTGISGNLSHAFYFSHTPWHSRDDFEAAVLRTLPGSLRYEAQGSYSDFYIRDMQTAERFLHGGSETYQVVRFFLKDWEPELKTERMNAWCAMLSYLPETDVLCVSFHYGFDERSDEELILLRQSGEHRRFRFQQGTFSCTELTQRFCADFGMPFEPTDRSYLLEITKLGDYSDLDTIRQKESKLLYGLITGDEGYAYVPDEIVEAGLRFVWGSRSFIRLYAFGEAFLFLNLIGSPGQRAYLAHQEAFGQKHYGGCDDYFRMGSAPLTVNHGILFSVEFVMTLKSLVGSVIAYQAEYESEQKKLSFTQRIRATRDFRRRVIVALQRVENTEISEIGALSGILMENQHISPIVEKVKYLLELLEADLDLMYSERNNFLVTVLTVLGLLLAVMQVVLGVVPLLL